MIDLRKEICKIVSEMLDNPDKCGIYPIIKCYDDLISLFMQMKPKPTKTEWEREFDEKGDYWFFLPYEQVVAEEVRDEVKAFIRKVRQQAIEETLEELNKLQYCFAGCSKCKECGYSEPKLLALLKKKEEIK